MAIDNKVDRIPFQQVLNSLLDESKPFPPVYLYRFSDLDSTNLRDLTKIWGQVAVSRRRAILEDLEDLEDADTLLSFEDLAKAVLDDPDGQVRATAIRLLWEIEDRKLVPIFMAILTDDPDFQVQAAAASGLGYFVYLGELEELPEELLHQVEDSLVAKVNGSDHDLVQRRALESLGYSSRAEVASLIEQAYNRGSEDWLASSIFAMGRSADDRWSDQVLSQFNNSSEKVREEAVRAAGELELNAARHPLIDLLTEEEDEDVQMAIVWSLSQIGGEMVRPLLERMLEETDDEDTEDFIENALENLSFTEDMELFNMLDVDLDEDNHTFHLDEDDGVLIQRASQKYAKEEVKLRFEEMSLHPLLLSWLALSSLIFTNAIVPVQTAINVVDAKVTYQFGEQITVDAQINTPKQIDSAYLLFQPQFENTRTVKLTPDKNGKISERVDLRPQPVRPFSKIYYWFRLGFVGGQEYTSPSFWFDYQDNRFQWQTLDDSIFTVHWYRGDLTFGQTVENIAHAGLDSIRKTLPLAVPPHLDIYVYANSLDLQHALPSQSEAWVGGSANPDLGMLMVAVDPGPEEKLGLERQIPHELSHMLLYNSTGLAYAKLPSWLTEGLASAAELYPNPDYQRALENSKNDQSMLHIDTLCGSFPKETSTVYLAYSEAAAFTHYIADRYGVSGLQHLIQEYQNGLGCSEGVQAAFGISLAELDASWQQDDLGIPVRWFAIRNLVPYAAIFIFLVVIPLMVSMGSIILRKRKEEPAKKYAKF